MGLVHEFPNRAEPKIGYALASAGLGRYEDCAQAMRRAFGQTPEGMRQPRLDDDLLPLITETIQWYRSRLDTEEADVDTAFMVAALNYLRGDLETARSLMERASPQEEASLARENLKRLLATASQADEDRETERESDSSSIRYPNETP